MKNLKRSLSSGWWREDIGPGRRLGWVLTLTSAPCGQCDFLASARTADGQHGQTAGGEPCGLLLNPSHAHRTRDSEF